MSPTLPLALVAAFMALIMSGWRLKLSPSQREFATALVFLVAGIAIGAIYYDIWQSL